MKEVAHLADGLYRLVKLEEDHNPVFPNQETVVEIRDGYTITNVSTGRSATIAALSNRRALYGPLKNAYDLRPLKELEQVAFMRATDTSEVRRQASGE